MKTKTCSVCSEIKDASNFQLKGKQCKSCRAAYRKTHELKYSELTEEQKKKRRAATESWRLRNPEIAFERARNKEYRKKYGITLEDYNTMLAKQNNVCAICQQSCATGMNLAVDHDHTTGKVRALLCKNCNTAIGLLGEDTDRMAKAIEYIQSHSERIS
jgi:hypothetical protein